MVVSHHNSEALFKAETQFTILLYLFVVFLLLFVVLVGFEQDSQKVKEGVFDLPGKFFVLATEGSRFAEDFTDHGDQMFLSGLLELPEADG